MPKKKSFQALSELSKDDYVDKHGVCYLKKTDQSILHILKWEGVIKKNPGKSLGPHPVSSWAKTVDITAACVCARIFMDLKFKAVIHHYLSKHLLHTHFKVPSTFLLLLRWLEQPYAGKSPPLTEREMGSLPEHSIWVKSVSDRSFCLCCNSSQLLHQNISDPL